MTDNRHENEKFEDVVNKAIIVFKDIDKALSWLNSPCHSLGDQIPIHLFETDDGIKLVLDMLNHIQNGHSQQSR
jgi:putative toxin-antitoxin system antitoxin component (TIGR02293 family)